MAGIKISVKTTSHWEELEQRVRVKMMVGNFKAAHAMEIAAVGFAPKKTGLLAGSIQSDASEDSAVCFAAAEYALFVEEGHSGGGFVSIVGGQAVSPNVNPADVRPVSRGYGGAHFLRRALETVAADLPRYYS